MKTECARAGSWRPRAKSRDERWVGTSVRVIAHVVGINDKDRFLKLFSDREYPQITEILRIPTAEVINLKAVLKKSVY